MPRAAMSRLMLAAIRRSGTNRISRSGSRSMMLYTLAEVTHTSLTAFTSAELLM